MRQRDLCNPTYESLMLSIPSRMSLMYDSFSTQRAEFLCTFPRVKNMLLEDSPTSTRGLRGN